MKWCLALFAFSLMAQDKYTGPRPTKTDVPYLLHADKLLELDAGTAVQGERKDNTLYTVAGAAAQARTPLPEPIFVIAADKIKPDALALWKMSVKGGSRELEISKRPGRSSARPVRLTAIRLAGDLYKLEVQEFIENGEYCMSPEGANQVFCFAAF